MQTVSMFIAALAPNLLCYIVLLPVIMRFVPQHADAMHSAYVSQ